MKRGDEIWLRFSCGEIARFRVAGASTHGVRGTWLDGFLAGREALIEKSVANQMAEAAKRGRAPTPADFDLAEVELRTAAVLAAEETTDAG